MNSQAFSGSLPGSTATSLIEALRVHDPAGWGRLVKLYSALVYSWCRRAGLQPADAAEVYQEVLLAVHRKIAAFDHGSAGKSFRGWLRIITRNKVRDFARRRKRQGTAQGGSDSLHSLSQVVGMSASVPFSMSSGITIQPRLLHEALAVVEKEFRPRTWQAFWAVTMEGRPPSDVAAELDMSPGAVHTIKWRVLTRLREFLRDLME
jgi:RNA polymerase sigma-70 factor (ECF subfamily)